MDGLWQIGDEWYFIEFKNDKIDHKKCKDAYSFHKQSLQCDEIQDSPSRNYIKARINQFAKRRFVLFGVISYEYIIFKSVNTYHQKEFESFIAHMKQMAVT